MAIRHGLVCADGFERERSSTIVVWDECDSHLPALTHVIAGCGARLRRLSRAWALQEDKKVAGLRAGLVAVRSPLSVDDPALEVMARLRQSRIQIIAYAEGARTWSLADHCRLLLAGCATVLDCGAATFADELERVLAETLQAENQRYDGGEQLTTMMAGFGVVGETQPMLSIFRTLVRIARVSDVPVLVTGETGTGKELLATTIHALDAKRQSGPFVAVNCAAISPALAESEFFGHRRGAFTGAERDRKGWFRAAHGGVLFLDEIAELPLGLQAKLLRVLQERRVLAVGEDREIPVDVRVVAASNCDLEEMVERHTFRPDLFHRLSVLSLRVPPLRERPADIPTLLEHFLRKHAALARGRTLVARSDFIDAVRRLDLPGNVRQLENLVTRTLVNKASDGPLGLRDLPSDVLSQLADTQDGGRLPVAGTGPRRASSDAAAAAPASITLEDVLAANDWNLARSLTSCEKELLKAILRRTSGNQAQAARLLGVTARTVYSKLRKHRLHGSGAPARC